MKVAIISWAGQHQRAVAIRSALVAASESCCIVYSELGEGTPDFEPDVVTLRRPDSFYWGDKFRAAIDWSGEGDLLIVHADCQCSNWARLFAKWRAEFREQCDLAVWSPLSLGTAFPLARTKIADVLGTSLKRVAQTDALVVGLRGDIGTRMRELDYGANVYGWGIDWVFVAAAQARGAYAAVDSAVIIHHKVGSGYPTDAAAQQMRDFLTQMTPAETAEYRYLSQHVRQLDGLRSGGRIL